MYRAETVSSPVGCPPAISETLGPWPVAGGDSSAKPRPLALVAATVAVAALIPTATTSLFAWFFAAEAIALCYSLRAVRLQRQRFSGPGPWHLFTGGAAVVAALQVLLGVTSSEYLTMGSLHFFVGMLFLLPLFEDAIAEARDFALALPLLLSAITLLLLIAFLAGLFTLHRPLLSSTGATWFPFVYRNHYAAFVILVLPLLLSEVRQWSLPSGIAAAGAILGIAGLVSSASRAALVLAIATVAVYAWLQFRHTQGSRWRRTFATLAIAGCGVALSSDVIWRYRIREAHHLLAGRWEYWQASLRMIAANPITGWGFDTWPDVYRQFATIDTGLIVNHAHSDWLEWTAEGGIVIAFALALVIVRAVRNAIAHPWSLGAPALLIYGAVDYPLRLPLIFATLLLFEAAARTLPASPAGPSYCRVSFARQPGPPTPEIRRIHPAIFPSHTN